MLKPTDAELFSVTVDDPESEQRRTFAKQQLAQARTQFLVAQAELVKWRETDLVYPDNAALQQERQACIEASEQRKEYQRTAVAFWADYLGGFPD
ncbi:MAG: hypothetical protein RLZZ200_2622, partial [Pseudomonadota bacterium]|jgi:hypothetical protein